MKWNPYVTFNGNCQAAFKYYERVLNGKIDSMMTFGESPMAQHAPPGWKDKIMHARMTAGDNVLMGSDAPPDRFEKPQGASIAVHVEEAKEAERIFAALADNGRITMPLQQTFWSERFGMLVDQFGIPWMVNGGRQQG
jgi:PhnB protein